MNIKANSPILWIAVIFISIFLVGLVSAGLYEEVCYDNSYSDHSLTAFSKICSSKSFVGNAFQYGDYFYFVCKSGSLYMKDSGYPVCDENGCDGVDLSSRAYFYQLSLSDVQTPYFVCWDKVVNGEDWVWSSKGSYRYNFYYDVQDVQDVQDVMEYPADNPDKQVQQPQKQQQNIAPVRTCQPQFEQPRVRPAVKDNSVRMPSEQQAPREKTAEEKSAETFNFDSAEMGMDEVPGMPDFSDDANDGQQ